MTDELVPTSLRYFLAIAEHGSLTAAARALPLSQPALTASMQALEESLGTTLFVRTSRGVVLTATGHELVKHARALVQKSGELRQAMSDLEHEPKGSFSIGCHESLGAYFLPGFMPNFFAAHPNIALSLWNGNSREVMAAVVERRVDVGIVVNPEPHPECVIVPLFEDHVELLVLTKQLNEDVSALPLLYVPVLTQTQWVLSRLPSSPRRHLTCSSMELVKSLVVDGAGVGILPRRVAEHGLSPSTLSPVPGTPRFEDRVALVRRVDMHETRAARVLLDALRDRGKALKR
jgi:DNA-binding transcriptional LysR family regulator